MKKKFDCVKLQREIRDKAFRRFKGKSLAEEVETVRQNLKAKGLDRRFESLRKSREKEGRPPSHDR